MKCTTGLAVLLLSGFLETALLADKTECPRRPVLEPGQCPSGRNRTCYRDSDCSGKQKCCEDLCDRHCTDPVSLTVVKGVCPVVGVDVECPSDEDELQHECNNDKDCLGNKICCLDYCELKCVENVNKKMVDDAPVIKGYHQKMINKFTQGNLKMTCIVEAKRKVQLSWYKREWIPVRPDLVHVKYQSRDGRKIVSQLRIKNVKCEDSGSYRCLATTESEYDYKYFIVTVYDRRKGYICP